MTPSRSAVDRFVVISGCSGGGKSTLLDELARRGHHVVEEPGRRIVRAVQAGLDSPLPWIDPVGFARRAIALALADRGTVSTTAGWIFFDRGLIDAASALEHVTGEPILDTLLSQHRYHRRVFLAPPWPAIHQQDGERRHDFAEAEAEFDRLARVYPSLGYEVVLLPQLDVVRRADFVLATLSVEDARASRATTDDHAPCGPA